MKNNAAYLLLASLLILSSVGCASTPASTQEPVNTSTLVFTDTSSITSTPEPTSTPTEPPTPTPTPRTPLSADNIDRWQVFQALGGISSSDIAFTPDGYQVVAAERNYITFYDAASHEIQQLIQSENPVLGLSINAEGTMLLAMDDQQNLATYQLPSGDRVGDPAPLQDVAGFCSEGETLSAYTWWWSRLFCLPADAARFTSDPYVGGLITMTFNPDASLAALGGQYGFELVSLAAGRKSASKWDTFRSKPVWGTAAAFSPDETQVALGFQDGLVSLMDVETGGQLAQYPVGGQVRGLAFDPAGSLLAVATNAGSKVIDLSAARIDPLGSPVPGLVNEMAFSPDGRTFLTVSDAALFMQWNVADGALISQRQGIPCKIDDAKFHWLCYSDTGAVAYSPDGRLVALGDNGSVQVLDSTSGEVLHQFQVGQVLSLAFSPDGARIAVGTLDIDKDLPSFPNGIQLWEVAGEKLLQTFPVKPCTHVGVLYNCTRSLAFTPDGQVLVTTGEKSISLWGTSTAEPLQPAFDPKMTRVDRMQLLPDGSLLAAQGDVLKLWLVSGREIAPNAFAIIPDVRMFALDPLGQFMAAASYVSGHGTAPDHYLVKILNVSDQALLGSFEIELGSDADPYNDSMVFSPAGDVLAIFANMTVYLYGVQP